MTSGHMLSPFWPNASNWLDICGCFSRRHGAWAARAVPSQISASLLPWHSPQRDSSKTSHPHCPAHQSSTLRTQSFQCFRFHKPFQNLRSSTFCLQPPAGKLKSELWWFLKCNSDTATQSLQTTWQGRLGEGLERAYPLQIRKERAEGTASGIPGPRELVHPGHAQKQFVDIIKEFAAQQAATRGSVSSEGQTKVKKWSHRPSTPHCLSLSKMACASLEEFWGLRAASSNKHPDSHTDTRAHTHTPTLIPDKQTNKCRLDQWLAATHTQSHVRIPNTEVRAQYSGADTHTRPQFPFQEHVWLPFSTLSLATDFDFNFWVLQGHLGRFVVHQLFTILLKLRCPRFLLDVCVFPVFGRRPVRQYRCFCCCYGWGVHFRVSAPAKKTFGTSGQNASIQGRNLQLAWRGVWHRRWKLKK